MNDQNPYAAPQTIETREELPPAPRARENRNYWWLKRGLASLAIVLSPLTIVFVGVFQQFALLGLAVILPICSGMLAAVPPRTPGKVFLLLAALAQVVGCFCLFVLVLMPKHDSEVYYSRRDALLMITGVAEIVFYVSLSTALLRIGHWLQDRWFCLLNYCSLALISLLALAQLLLIYWIRLELKALFPPEALMILAGLAYLTLWLAMIFGLRIPRLVCERIPNPPRLKKR